MPIGRDEALRLARAADEIVACRGKRVVRFDMRATRPDDASLASAILGPTGNLRAPAMKIGRTLIVGFDETTCARYLLGGRAG